jgi:hypothetical protein
VIDKRDKAEIELEPDAWSRFERAVDVVAKSPPQHRTKAKAGKAKRRRLKSIQKRGNAEPQQPKRK